MKQLKFKLFALLILIIPAMTQINAQEKEYKDLEDLQDRKENYYVDIYNVVKEYPDFTYEYIYKKGELKDVKVTGVDRVMDQKRLELYIYNLKSSDMIMENAPSRTGIYYSAEQDAEPEMGYNDFHDKLYENLNYPDEASNKGVEGTVFVKFVVDENGNINFARADEDIETPYPNAVKQMKESAIEAVITTSGKWKPAKVGGVPVAEWVVLPVVFNFEKNPSIKALIR